MVRQKSKWPIEHFTSCELFPSTVMRIYVFKKDFNVVWPFEAETLIKRRRDFLQKLRSDAARCINAAQLILS